MPNYSIPYGRQHISEEDIQTVVEVLKSDYLTQGPAVIDFEKAFASYVGAKYAVAVSNGTAALHLSNMVLGVNPGQKVLTTPITFAATANSVLYCGGEVDFVDIDPETFLMDLDLLEIKLKSAAKGTYAGVIPVDFTGLAINTEKLRSLTDEFGLWVIEDACHSPGGYFINSADEAVKCGSGQYSDLTCFSFHPVKHIAAGEGGMITTNNEDLYKQLLKLRTHGITKENLDDNHGGWYYEMQTLGFNYRLPDINAALGNSQLKQAKEGVLRRKEIAERYDQAFKPFSFIKTQKTLESVSHAYHLYVIEVPNRLALYEYLRKHGIYAQVHYIPVHRSPFYHKLGWKELDFPIAENYYEHCLSLPMYPSLSEEELDFVIDTVSEFF